jgi:tetratricopeptide (TPR) repeat protein
LALQQRYIHALIACGFYRFSFKGGDLNLNKDAYPSGRSAQGSENTPSVPSTGGAPTQLPVISTITGMEAFLQNRIRDSMQERESIDNMLRENQLSAAESLLRKMVLTAKYQPELQTIPFQSRQSILQSGRKLRQISDAVNAKDYDQILKLVDSIEANEPLAGVADLKSFANEHPRKALHWARQAELAMKAGDKKTMSSLMDIAIRRAPLNQEVAQKIQSIQENAQSNNDLLEELKRIVSAGDYRTSFERMNEFAPLAQSSNTDFKLKDAYEKLIESEKALRVAIEKTDSLENKGLMPEAWIELNALPQAIANDTRVLERKNRISAECPKFIKAYHKATNYERENQPAKALAWYLNALVESPSNNAITSKVNLLGGGILKN